MMENRKAPHGDFQSHSTEKTPLFPESERWTVAKLTRAIRNLLEKDFSKIVVEGEISNCRRAASGHIYFTLKDSEAVISAVLFKNRSFGAAQPQDGMQVVVSGRLDIYPPRGSYQIIVNALWPSGRGALLEILERRKQKLAAEGLFDRERKKALPLYPRRVVVITSHTGAALKDILEVLKRRKAAPGIIILPCTVQGGEAAGQMVNQLRRAAVYALGDAVILTRGGGSLEDLMPFNEEEVVRAVADCPLPVLCGVGHEIDWTLAELAADIRAATPSEAAELVSERSEDLLNRVQRFVSHSGAMMGIRLKSVRLSITPAKDMKKEIRRRLEDAKRALDDVHEKLLEAARSGLMDLRRRMERASQSLHDASPAAVMNRGYARISLQNGQVVHDAAVLNAGDMVHMKFARGGASAHIDNVDEVEEA